MFKSLCWLLGFCSVSHHWLTDNKASWLQGDTFKGLLDHPLGTYFSLGLSKWMFIRLVKQMGFSSLANFQFYIAFIPWISCSMSEVWRKIFMTGCQARLWSNGLESVWLLKGKGRGLVISMQNPCQGAGRWGLGIDKAEGGGNHLNFNGTFQV